MFIVVMITALAAWLFGMIIPLSANTWLPVCWVNLAKAGGLAAVYGLFSLVLGRWLGRGALYPGNRYRLAVMSGFGVFCLEWLFLVFTRQVVSPAWLAVAFVGCFMGGLGATSLHEGVWENNSPPSADIQEEVRRRHIEHAGEPAAIKFTKRCFDMSLALAGLLISLPVWLVSAAMIWFEDPGPLLFVKNSVGRGGINFRQYKFRTMVRSAESNTGPVLASEDDGRVLIVGRLLRKTALDELPQLINIARGEMSFVGPRPQRTVLVHAYLQSMPEYAQRHLVLPGLSGLAQVAGDYYLSPRQKFRFDRLYIQHAGFGFDLKLLALALLITFWYRWRAGWNGRLPRSLLRFGSPSR